MLDVDKLKEKAYKSLEKTEGSENWKRNTRKRIIKQRQSGEIDEDEYIKSIIDTRQNHKSSKRFNFYLFISISLIGAIVKLIFEEFLGL